MAESIHEQIVAAIETSLEGIVGDGGDTYWYTPGAVTRVTWDEERLLDSSIDGPIYALRPGEETHAESTTGEMEALAEIHVLVATTFESAETPLEPADTSRATVVNRMVRDVLRKLLTDVQITSIGGAVDNVFDGSVVIDRDRYVAGWALAEIIFTIKYRYAGGVP